MLLSFTSLKLFFLTLSALIPALLAVALFTIAERKILAGLQRRQGPTVVGIWGFLQVLADGFKLLLKSTRSMSSKRNKLLFIICPIISFILSFSMWSLIPFSSSHIISCINYGLLWLLALSSLKVYTIFFSGWSSNSKYPLLGGLRSVAQVISYEISLGFCFLCVAILSGTFDLMGIVLAQRNGFFFFPLLPIAILFFVVIVAETNRPPFDMAEAESELVAGYNLEYSAIYFAYLFLSEYCSIIVMSALWVILFFGGWLPILNCFNFIPEVIWMVFKTLLICFFIILGRGIMPRYRYDQLMSLGWKVFFILSFCFLIFLVVICFCFGFNKKQKYCQRFALNKKYYSVTDTSLIINKPYYRWSTGSKFYQFRKYLGRSRREQHIWIQKFSYNNYFWNAAYTTFYSRAVQIFVDINYRPGNYCLNKSYANIFNRPSYLANSKLIGVSGRKKRPLKSIIKYTKTPSFGLCGQLSINKLRRGKG